MDILIETPEQELARLDWIEQTGIESMKAKQENAAMIAKEANTLLTLLMTGGGASLAFFLAKPPEQPMFWAAMTTSVWLFALAAALTALVLALEAFPAVWNEPKHLRVQGYSLAQLKGFELDNLQERINEAIEIVNLRSAWLNRLRYAAAATPIVSIVAWVSAR